MIILTVLKNFLKSVPDNFKALEDSPIPRPPAFSTQDLLKTMGNDCMYVKTVFNYCWKAVFCYSEAEAPCFVFAELIWSRLGLLNVTRSFTTWWQCPPMTRLLSECYTLINAPTANQKLLSVNGTLHLDYFCCGDSCMYTNMP